MRRIVYTGLGYEVLHGKERGPDGELIDIRVLRFIDEASDTIHDFPLSMGDWENVKAMGDRKPGEDPLKGFEVVKQMPGVLRQPPPPRPPR